MSHPLRIAALLAALALVAAACGGTTQDDGSATGDLPQNPAATCLAGDPDCNDIPGNDAPTLEPGDPDAPVTPGGNMGMPIDGGGLSVADALSSDVDGPIAVFGFVVQGADGARLCDALAESFPPQCGGAAIDLSDISTIDVDQLKSEQGVTWTDAAVTVIGEIVGGVFTVTPLSS